MKLVKLNILVVLRCFVHIRIMYINNNIHIIAQIVTTLDSVHLLQSVFSVLDVLFIFRTILELSCPYWAM